MVGRVVAMVGRLQRWKVVAIGSRVSAMKGCGNY